MNNNLNIAAIEYDIVWGNIHENLQQVSRQLATMPQSIDLVILPEMFSTGFIVDKDMAEALAERNTGATISALRAMAAEYRVAIAGSYLARTAGRLYNRAFLIEPNGDESFYDKRHLFRMGGERDVYGSGDVESPVVRYRGWNIKIVVCYDLRFPVWCRSTARQSYDLLLVVANWPKVRSSAWHTLLAARAIENECYVCGVNRCGNDAQGIDYASHLSKIYDYKGFETGKWSEDEHTLLASLDYDKLIAFRDKFPVWKDADDFSIVI